MLCCEPDLLYTLPWSGFESYSISHLVTQARNSFFDCSILNHFKNLSRYVFIEKSYQASWSISIYLDAQYVSNFTEVFHRKNSYSGIPICYPEILYHFQSTICHQHIILQMLQSSHSLSCKYSLLQKSV